MLGTIFLGIATPTEGGAMGATGALVLALMKRRLSLDLMRQAMDSTAKLSAFVIFILIGARVFSLTFYGVDGHKWVEELLVGLPGGEVGFLIVVNILVFVLAFFLDFFELAFIIVPLLGPAAERLGIDLIWFGVILGVNMQTSFMHPPFGFALFYLRSVAPKSPISTSSPAGAWSRSPPARSTGAPIPFVVIQVHHGRPGDRLPRHGHALQGCRHRGRPGLDPAARHAADGGPAAARLRRPGGALPGLEPPARAGAAARTRASAGLPAWSPSRGAAELDRRAAAPGQLRTRVGQDAHAGSGLGAQADRVAVEAVLGDLPPQILLGAEGHHVVVDLLEVGILGRGLGIDLLRRLEARPPGSRPRRAAAARRAATSFFKRTAG